MKRIKVINYLIHSNRVEVFLSNGQILNIFFNEQSGTAFFRYKINTISKIKHPGIFVGVDQNSIEYFIHNHYQVGTTVLCDKQNFSKDRPIYIYNEKCTNNRITVIDKAFKNLMQGEKYHFYSNNCQTMVNDSYSNTRRSKSVENWTIVIIFLSVFVFLLTIASSGKNRIRVSR